MSECIDHLDFVGIICPDCNLEVNEYGNTEGQPIDYCQFPDCGCDGARLCMANKPNENADQYNVEGMYTDKNPRARLDFSWFIFDKYKDQ